VEVRPSPESVSFCDAHELATAAFSDHMHLGISGDPVGDCDIRALQSAIQCLTPSQRVLFQSRNDSRIQHCHRGTTAASSYGASTQLAVMLYTLGLVVIVRLNE
jgi:hypothetical protein